jgi:hypothetical protein
MVIPDTQAHLDGHAIVIHPYSIFLDIGAGNALMARSKESTLDLNKNNDPDYCEYIATEKAGYMFTYTADGERKLSAGEVTELIEHLNYVRDNSTLWNKSGE